MDENIAVMLTGKDDVLACALADKIIAESLESDKWYPCFDEFAALLSHPKSLVRNRALRILAANGTGKTGLMPSCRSTFPMSPMKSPSLPGSVFRLSPKSGRQSPGIFRRFSPACKVRICQSTRTVCAR